jgi:DNA-binding NtrC family response regulator
MRTINRILLVDDEATFRQTLRRHLKREGFQLEMAADGNAACREISRAAAGEQPFDMVITDVLMPEMDGIQLLSWIKDRHPAISVIVLSGFGDGDSVARAVRSAVDGYGAKPITPRTMMALIDRIDRHREQGKAPRENLDL